MCCLMQRLRINVSEQYATALRSVTAEKNSNDVSHQRIKHRSA